MTTNMTFGECLGCLLSELKLSINRLSKAINVDNSLVSRWIHGKRIPPYHSSYIEDISEYLSSNIHNTIQSQKIEELFLNVVGDYELQISIKDKIRKVLLETQGFSIECRERERREGKEAFSQRAVVSNSLSNEIVHDKKTYIFTDPINLSSEDKIIFNINNLLTASTILVEDAAKLKCRSNSTIYISFLHEISMENVLYENVIRFRNALLKAIDKEWNVVLLIKLSNNVNKTIRLLEYIKPLVMTGKFNVHYIKKCEGFLLGREIVVVPDVGVLCCFSTKLRSETNGGFYMKNKTAVNIFKESIDMLIRNNSTQLIKYYQYENIMEYSSFLLEKEENIGSRFLYKYYFSDLALTEGLYKKILKRKNWSSAEIEKAIRFFRKRVNAFLINIESYEYRDIYYTDSIRELTVNQKIHFYSYKGIEQADLEVEEIIEYLQNIVELLKKYKNFSIAFDPLKNQCVGENELFYCLTKERQAVFFEVSDSSNCASKVRMSIDEPIMVQAFSEYFSEIWEQISPLNREKTEIIKWIERQINILQNKQLITLYI